VPSVAIQAKVITLPPNKEGEGEQPIKPQGKHLLVHPSRAIIIDDANRKARQESEERKPKSTARSPNSNFKKQRTASPLKDSSTLGVPDSLQKTFEIPESPETQEVKLEEGKEEKELELRLKSLERKIHVLAASLHRPDALCFTELFCETLNTILKVGNDTMANINIVGRKFLNMHRTWVDGNIRKSKGTLKGVGSRTEITGIVTLIFKLKSGRLYRADLYVVPDYHGSILLSYAQLATMGAVIDCAARRVIYGVKRGEEEEINAMTAADSYEAYELSLASERKKLAFIHEATEHHVQPYVTEPDELSWADNWETEMQVNTVTIPEWDKKSIDDLIVAREKEIICVAKRCPSLARFAEGGGADIHITNGYCFHAKVAESKREAFVPRRKGRIPDTPAEDIKTFITNFWGDVPTWPRSLTEVKKCLRTLFESNKPYTVILPYNEKAIWAQEVRDRLIDHPIPIPSRKQQLVVACRLGPRELSSAYRLKLRAEDKLKLIPQAFTCFDGFYTRKAPLQYATLIDMLVGLGHDDEPDTVTYERTGLDDLSEEDLSLEEDLAPLRVHKKMSEEDFQAAARKILEEGGGSEREKAALKAKMEEYREIFDPPRAGGVRSEDFTAVICKIPGAEPSPAPRRANLSIHEAKIAEEQVRQLLNEDFIERSTSPIVSQPKIVPKPGGEWRLTINYARVNKVLEEERNPLPTLEEGRRVLRNAKFYSVIDLKNGFWQIPLDEKSRWLTAFVVGMEIYQWKVLPMGLKQAPGLFQKAMQKMLSSQYEDQSADGFMRRRGQKAGAYAFCYIDDIIVYSNTMDEHIEHLSDVFRRVRAFGLKCNLKKCQLAKTSVTYLGYEISHNRVSISQAKREEIMSRQLPRNRTELHSFLAMAQYYSQFIPDWGATRAKLEKMIDLGDFEKWDEEALQAFNTLKELIYKDPKDGGLILMMPDFTKPFVVDTDASKFAIGAVLQQEDEEKKLRPIMFISRKLCAAERNYCTRQREALAVVWALKRLREYLWGGPLFTVRTDHHNLLWLMNHEQTGRLARWQAFLSCFNFTMVYLPGKRNVIADSLSRLEFHSEVSALVSSVEVLDLSTDKVYEVSHIEAMQLARGVRYDRAGLRYSPPGPEHGICCEAHVLEDAEWSYEAYENAKADIKEEEETTEVCAEPPQENRSELDEDPERVGVKLEDGIIHIASPTAWRQQQAMDPEFKELITLFKEPNELKKTPRIKEQMKEMAWRDGLLWYKGQHGKFASQPDKWTLWVPEKLRRFIFVAAHNCPLLAHPGRQRTHWFIARRFWWKRMKEEIDREVDACIPCKTTKTPLKANFGLIGSFPLHAGMFEFIHIDHVGPFPESAEGYRYLLTAIDRATNYVWIVPVKDVTGKTTAEALIDRIVSQIGVPRKICSDRGSDFKNEVIDRLSQYYGMKWQYVTAYNPRANGKIERVHRPLKASLKMYCMKKENQRAWVEAAPSFAFAMNCLPSTALGGARSSVSPYQLVYGREPNIPTSLLHPKDTWADEDELFGMRLRVKMEAEQLVAAHREAERRKTDAQGVRQAHLDQVRFRVGDIVLLYHPQVPKGVSSKLFTHWKGPYQIMEQMGPLNYKIRGRGKVQIVNVRRLIKYDPFLLEDESVEEALKRMKEDFKEVPPLRKEDTLEEENAYHAPASEKEETEKESKEDSHRKSAAGTQSKAPMHRGGTEEKITEAQRRRAQNDLIFDQPRKATRSTRTAAVHGGGEEKDINPNEGNVDIRHAQWKEGKAIETIKWVQDSFYLMRPAEAHVADDTLSDLYLMRVVAVPQVTRATRARSSKIPLAANIIQPVLHFWRSMDPVEVPKARQYLPVYRDAKNLETWDDTITLRDEDHTAWTIQSLPRGVLDIPFDLSLGAIPNKIWDILEESKFDLTFVGGPPPGKGVRARRRRQ